MKNINNIQKTIAGQSTLGKITEYDLDWKSIERGSTDVDSNNPLPAGPDYILRFDKSIRGVIGTQLSGVSYRTFVVPSADAMLHRIRLGRDGNLWFTEMRTDRIGKVESADSSAG
jgi:hypothetical protein